MDPQKSPVYFPCFAGIFDSNKQNSSYPAFIRFSNGEGRGFVPIFGTNTSDAVPDTRGFAIKLFGVKGPKVLPGQESDETQDFLLITSPTNFLGTLDQAVSFFQAARRCRQRRQIFCAASDCCCKLRQIRYFHIQRRWTIAHT